MEKGQDSIILYKLLDSKEEVIVDREGNIFDLVLSICSISPSKEWLWEFKTQGNDVLNVVGSLLYHFSIEKTLHFPKFVEWCVNNYSLIERVIMKYSNTTIILYQINARVFCEVLNVPENFSKKPNIICEEAMVRLYKGRKPEDRNVILSKILKTNQSMENLYLPSNVIFFREVQLVFYILSQILGV